MISFRVLFFHEILAVLASPGCAIQRIVISIPVHNFSATHCLSLRWNLKTDHLYCHTMLNVFWLSLPYPSFEFARARRCGIHLAATRRICKCLVNWDKTDPWLMPTPSANSSHVYSCFYSIIVMLNFLAIWNALTIKLRRVMPKTLMRCIHSLDINLHVTAKQVSFLVLLLAIYSSLHHLISFILGYLFGISLS